MGCCNHSLSWDCNKYGPLLDCSQAGSLWWLWRGSSHLYLACINYPENRIGRMFLISALQFACCGILPFQLLVINHESKFDGWAVQNSRNSLDHLTPYTPPPPPPHHEAIVLLDFHHSGLGVLTQSLALCLVGPVAQAAESNRSFAGNLGCFPLGQPSATVCNAAQAWLLSSHLWSLPVLSVIMNQGRLILLGSEASSHQSCVT